MLVLVAGVGCDDNEPNPYRPTGPLRQKWSSSGDRLAIHDASGEIAVKLRRRSRDLKVYDEKLTPAGYVGPIDETFGATDDAGDGAGADAGGAEDRTIRVRPVGDTQGTRLERRNDDLWQLDGAFRLERTPDGWTVFGADGNWVGRFFQADGGDWRLSTAQSGTENAWRVVEKGETMRLERGDETRYRAPVGTVSKSTLLALALDELPMLHRVAVGFWLRGR